MAVADAVGVWMAVAFARAAGVVAAAYGWVRARAGSGLARAGLAGGAGCTLVGVLVMFLEKYGGRGYSELTFVPQLPQLSFEVCRL
jgi:hypothetical protein